MVRVFTVSLWKGETMLKQKTASTETKSIIYHSEDMLRIGICTFGWKTKLGRFPVALVTFVDSTGGEYKEHSVRPFMRQTVAMRHAKHFAETGEVRGEGETL